MSGGSTGKDGAMLLEFCREHGVDTRFIRRVAMQTGNAVIQVSDTGENSIVLFPGANFQNDTDYVKQVLNQFEAGDFLILQNEINCLREMIDLAYERGMKIVLNPSPMNRHILEADLRKITYFIMNETEGYQITGKMEPEEILKEMTGRFPGSKIVLTLGEKGAFYQEGERRAYQDSYKVKAVDTTAAGDTFTGYFLAAIIRGMKIEEALKCASKASSITASRMGAAVSIPYWQEVFC